MRDGFSSLCAERGRTAPRHRPGSLLSIPSIPSKAAGKLASLSYGAMLAAYSLLSLEFGPLPRTFHHDVSNRYSVAELDPNVAVPLEQIAA